MIRRKNVAPLLAGSFVPTPGTSNAHNIDWAWEEPRLNGDRQSSPPVSESFGGRSLDKSRNLFTRSTPSIPADLNTPSAFRPCHIDTATLLSNESDEKSGPRKVSSQAPRNLSGGEQSLLPQPQKADTVEVAETPSQNENENENQNQNQSHPQSDQPQPLEREKVIVSHEELREVHANAPQDVEDGEHDGDVDDGENEGENEGEEEGREEGGEGARDDVGTAGNEGEGIPEVLDFGERRFDAMFVNDELCVPPPYTTTPPSFNDSAFAVNPTATVIVSQDFEPLPEPQKKADLSSSGRPSFARMGTSTNLDGKPKKKPLAFSPVSVSDPAFLNAL